MTTPSYEILVGDVLDQIQTIADNSIDAVITDPPYNVKIAGWDAFPTNREYGEWCQQWATECYRVLKPGGAMLSFSGARTYHWLACGIEDAGFITRDMIEWVYWASFAKGKNLKPGHEPIYYGIKDPVGEITFNLDDCRIPMDRRQKDAIESWLLPAQPTKPRADIWSSKGNTSRGKKYNAVVGKKEKAWKHTTNPPHPGGRVPYNVLTNYNLDIPVNFIDVKKPRGRESIADHPTQKPLRLMMWLIKLTTNKGDVVLDPFGGSGTTAEAALLLGRDAILIEREADYIPVIEDRLTSLPNQWILEDIQKEQDKDQTNLLEW